MSPALSFAGPACVLKSLDAGITVSPDASADITIIAELQNAPGSPPLVLVPFELVLPGLSEKNAQIASDAKLKRSRDRIEYHEATLEPPVAAGETRRLTLKIHAPDAVVQSPEDPSFAMISFMTPRFPKAASDFATIRILPPAGITANEIRWSVRKPDVIGTSGDRLSLLFKTRSAQRETVSAEFPARAFTRLPTHSTDGGVTIGTLFIVLVGILAGYALFLLRRRREMES